VIHPSLALSPALAMRMMTLRLRVGALLWPLGIGLAAAIVYLLVGPHDADNAFTALATAFLHGRLWVPDGSSAELVKLGNGHNYVPFPPAPALPFLPFAALGIGGMITTLAAVAGGCAVALAYPLLRHLEVELTPAKWITAGLAGTLLWFAGTGGTWLYAQVLALALALGALNLAVRGRLPILAGLLLGLAAGSRLPVGLLLPLFIYLYRGSWPRLAQLGAGMLVVALPIMAYNVARFGSPLEFGYGMIASWNGVPTVSSEQWYASGIESLTYIPRSIGVMLFAGPAILTGAPWFRPDWSGLSIAFTAPMFLLALPAWRIRLGAIALGTAALVMLPNWAHGNWGFYQFGYRYLMDAMPALLVALALLYRHRIGAALAGAVLLGAAVNAYGLWADAANFIGGPTF
jgi:hypothetical protein